MIASIANDLQTLMQSVNRLGASVNGHIDRVTITDKGTGQEVEVRNSKIDPRHTGAVNMPFPSNRINQLSNQSSHPAPVPDLLEELQVQGNILHETIGQLEQRLERITSPRPPAAAATGGETRGNSTIAAVIHDRILMVKAARVRLEGIMEMLEI